MKIISYDKGTGEIQQWAECPDLESMAHVRSDAIDIAAVTGDCSNHYFQDGELRPILPRPSQSHDWDWVSKTWLPNLAHAKEMFKARIDGERVRRNTLPIAYDGKNLDADATAQKNLADKLAGVKERIRLGVGMPMDKMVWKDADNIVHWWNDLQAYCDWLAGYVIALEDRGTALYISMWQHKLNIDALTTIEEILAYDTTTGWPA